MKEAVRDLLGAIGRVINFLFPFRLPQRIYRHMGFKGTFVFKIEKNKLRFINVRESIANDIFYSGIFGNYEGETIIFCEILDRDSMFKIFGLFNKIDYVFINIHDKKKRLIYTGTSAEDLSEDLGINWVILPKQIMESTKIKDIFLKF